MHLGTKILSQFSGSGYFSSLSLNSCLESFCCQRLFTITDRCGDILGPCLSSSAKSLESWSRKSFVGGYDSVEIMLAKSILFGEFPAVSSLATLVLVCGADTIIWNFIIIRDINISVALLGISPGNTMVFLYDIRCISPGVSSSLSSYSSWNFSPR